MSVLGKILHQIVTDGLERFGRYYSVYRGYVASNEDPDGYGRLQLYVPQVYGVDKTEYWAWPKHTFSGPNYGSHVIPPERALVWVEFEFGNPRRPIWSHGHFGKDDITEANLRSVKNFWFKTPGGHLIELDDENNIIRLTHQDGTKVVLKEEKVFLGSDEDTEYLAKGDSLKAELQKEKNRVDLLYQAIQSATVTPQDGGASMKASMIAIIQPGQAPDYTNILSDKVKTT